MGSFKIGQIRWHTGQAASCPVIQIIIVVIIAGCIILTICGSRQILVAIQIAWLRAGVPQIQSVMMRIFCLGEDHSVGSVSQVLPSICLSFFVISVTWVTQAVSLARLLGICCCLGLLGTESSPRGCMLPPAIGLAGL